MLKIYRPVKGVRNKDRRITQYYGENFKRKGRRMYGEIVRWWKHHEWLDYAGPRPWVSVGIYSSTEGKVIHAGRKGARWNCIVIEYNNHHFYYAHLRSVAVSVGQLVSPMEHIGEMGTTGNSTGVHLHFGVKKVGWWWIDPTPYVCNWEKLQPKENKPQSLPLVDDGIRDGERPHEPVTRLESAIMLNRLANTILKYK